MPNHRFQIYSTPGFYEWLSTEDLSIAFSTYRMGKLFLLGRGAEGRLSVNERTFNRCMGLSSDTQTLWMASGFQIWRMENMLRANTEGDDCDRLFVPHQAVTTGDIDVHDLAVDGGGELYFVSSLFCCVATLDDRLSFRPFWRPPFLTKLVPEDRCHLNGLGCVAGRPRYATVCAESDEDHGWRAHKRDGGCVIDMDSNAIIARGLSMPHSPRYYHGKLWVLDSGHGQFGYVDLDAGKFEPVMFCPGFSRGLTFIGKYAIVGLSRPRDSTFKGLDLDAELERRGVSPFCGLIVIDLEKGAEVHRLTIDGAVDELYDVITLPGVRCPKAFGLKADDVRRNVWFMDDERIVRFTARES